MNDVTESFNIVALHRNVEPERSLNSILPTASAAWLSAADCGVTHARSMLQLPESPMSAARLASIWRRSSPAITRCDSGPSVSGSPSYDAPAPACTSIVAVSPSSTGDQNAPRCADASATAFTG